MVEPSSSQSGALGKILPLTQGPTQLARGGDQPPNKNIPLDKTYQDGLVQVIRMETESEKKKA